MWVNIRSLKTSLASRNIKLFPSDESEHGLPLDELSQPLLPSTSHSSRAIPLTRPVWRTRLRYGIIIACGLVVLLITSPLLNFLHLYTDPGYDDTFDSAPFIPDPAPVEGLVSPLSLSIDYTPATLHDELSSRLASIGMPTQNTLNCTPLSAPETELRYAHLRSRGPTLVALNLHQNAEAFPSLASQLLDLAVFLGPTKVHVSIFENGSPDSTPMGMAHLSAVLTRIGVPHTITSDPRETEWSEVDRIEQLSVYRNIALEPLFANSTDQSTVPFETVLFVNDVFACPSDTLELLHQRVVQNAHATCGLDYRWRRSVLSGSGPKFYDNWVSRSLTGMTLRSRLDVFAESRDGLLELFSEYEDLEYRDRFRAGRVLPMYSCWNGMIALDARPFLGITVDGGVARDKVVFRGARRRRHECAASECKLIAKDFWTRNFDRWVLVPHVRVTYERDLYDQEDLVNLAHRAQLRWRIPQSSQDPLTPNHNSSVPLQWAYPHTTSTVDGLGEEVDFIDWSGVTGPESVVCWPYHRVGNVEWWWTRVVEKVTSAQ